MKNLTRISALLLFIFLSFTFLAKPLNVQADWWQRPAEDSTPTRIPLPTHRDEPTSTPVPVIPTTVNPSPTTIINPTSSQPTPTGFIPTPTTEGGIGGTTDTGNNEDACDPGKPYTGPYCGWSPSLDQPANNTSVTSQTTPAQIKVLGLSRTSGPELTVSDIMLFTGLLCLALYLKSKMSVKSKEKVRS